MAADSGLIEHPHSRCLKRIKVRKKHVVALTHDEIHRLLDAASCLNGKYKNGIGRPEYWQAVIVGAYDTGARRGDLIQHLPLLPLLRGDAFTYVDHKEDRVHLRQLSPLGIEKLMATGLLDRRLAYPWTNCIKSGH